MLLSKRDIDAHGSVYRYSKIVYLYSVNNNYEGCEFDALNCLNCEHITVMHALRNKRQQL